MFFILTTLVIFSFANAKDRCNEYNVGLDVNNPVIPDSAFSASSMATYGYRAVRGRLNTIYQGTSDKKGGWMASNSDAEPWIDVDLQKIVEVAGVITQGRQCGDNWVTQFRIEYKYGSAYYSVIDPNTDLPKIFNGNSDRNTMVTNYLPNTVHTRNIRIRPIEYYGSAPSLRFEVIGCRFGGN